MKPAISTDGRRTRVRRRVSAALGILGIAALVCAQVQPARAAAPSSTLTTLSAAPSSPSTYGEYVTLTATVFPTSGTVPTGSVSFDEELVPGIVSSHLGDAPVVAAGNNGSASFAINTLSVGSHNLVAKYGGDAANLTSTSATLSYSVTKASTSTALSSSKNPSTSGDSVTFTAVVTSSGGIPTGTVNFDDSGSPIGAGTLDSTGTATFSTTTLNLGTHSITAVYGGDTNFTTSTSASVSQLVRAASAIALTAAPNPQTYGATVTLTATVTGSNGTPTGTVNFMDGASAIGSPIALDNTGKAVLASTALTTGGHSLTAVYSGDNAYSGSTSTVSTEGVQQATPTVALGASANPSPFGTQLDLTTTVTGPGGATAGPSGTVTVKDGSTVIGTATLSGGHATVSTATLAVGVHSLTAHYSSDTNYTSGADGTLSETVSKAATVTALGVAPSPGISGQAVALSATVTGSGGTPSGTVTFKDGTTTLGSPATVGANGKATLSAGLAPGAHSLTAVYSGDGTYLTSTSSATSETVLDLTTTTLSSSAAQNTTSFGQSVSITATVTAQTLGSTPTGTITFKDGATQLGTPVSLDVNGKAVYTSSALAVGAHSITAAYSGDAAFNTSTSSVLTETVTKASTTTALQSSAASSVFGQEVDLTATITPANGGSPSGTVTFMDGATALGSPVAISGGTAVLATTTLPVGAHSITADYNGDGSFLTSTSSTASVTVTQATTSTVLTSDLATPVHGQSVTLTATVSGPAGTPAPTGTVTFKDGSTALGSPVGLDGNGKATLTTAALAGGAHSLSAVYSGDTSFTGSTGTLSLTVTPQTTSTLLTTNTNPSVYEQSVTLTATVSGAGASGTVTFKDGTTTLGTPVALRGGVATLSVAFPKGTHSLTAAYSGDASFQPSTSSAVSQQVGQAASTTALASDTNPSTYGGAVTFTATVAAKAPGGGTPTGSVTFMDGVTALGSPVALSGGKATYTTSALTAGSHAITAVYGGDTDFTGSSAAAAPTQTVNQAVTTTAVTSPAGSGSSGYGATVTLTATVSGAGATGTVTFKNGSTVIAGPLALSAGQVTTAVSSLAAGSYSITAVYGGDANFLTSTSTAVAYTVTQGASGSSLGFSPTAPVFGQQVTFTATLSGAGGGSYGGTVTFKDGSTVLGSPVTPTGATATLTTSSLAAGTHSITATYAGDANLAGSTSAAAAVTVAKAATTTTLASSANPSAEGQVTYTATVAVTAPGAGIPSGTIAFSDGGSPITGCAGQPLASGKATCTVSYTTPGSHAVTAAYSGDGSFVNSSSSTLNQTITGPAAVSVNLQSHALAANGRATTQVYAQLKDNQGNNLAYPGDTVTFTSSAGLTFTDASGATTTDTAVTNASGLATVKVVASTHAGTVLINATTADSPALTGSDHLKLTGSHFGATALSQTRIAADGHSTTVATAQVLDGAGNPVSGESVNFASSGASVAQPSVVTDGNGNASDTVTSSTTPGTDPVTLADGNFVDNPSTTLALTLLPALGPSNSSFIHNAYVTMLGRDVDPGAYSYWLGALNSGTPRSVLAMALASSAEYRSDVISGTPTIQGFYMEYLGRPSDAAGAAYWVSQMAKGMTFEQVRLQFVGSPEYFIHHNSDPGQTIDALYNDILGRSDATDPAGKAYWLANFNVNTIAAQFLYSYEGRAHLVDGYYASILNRGNDAAGLAYWTQAILRGASDENVITDFLSSQEYFLSH